MCTLKTPSPPALSTLLDTGLLANRCLIRVQARKNTAPSVRIRRRLGQRLRSLTRLLRRRFTTLALVVALSVVAALSVLVALSVVAALSLLLGTSLLWADAVPLPARMLSLVQLPSRAAETARQGNSRKSVSCSVN